jgi:hypothetical protein
MTVIDIVTADTVEDGDTIRYVTPKGQTFTLDVKGTPVDTGTKIHIHGYSHEFGENITVKFSPSQRVDILGS